MKMKLCFLFFVQNFIVLNKNTNLIEEVRDIFTIPFYLLPIQILYSIDVGQIGFSSHTYTKSESVFRL
jgi:hypothetical protein